MERSDGVKISLVKARTLLSKRIEGDSWFHSNYSMNIYRGCQFACAYCDGMSEHYHVDNYTTHIRVKTNAPEILKKELDKIWPNQRKKTLYDFTDGQQTDPRKQIIGISGGVSDSYQQAEKEHRVTRKVLQVLYEKRLPVFILTKSDLVLRDIEILKQINETAFANVCFSIAFSENKTKQRLEPNSPSIFARLEALKLLRSEGIRGGVMAMPIVPFIGDSHENMGEIAYHCKDHEAEFVLFSGMTLKPGRQKNHFLRMVGKHFPDKLNDIMACYSNNNKYGVPREDALDPSLIGPIICEKAGIKWLSTRHCCPGEFNSNTLVLKKLLESIYLDGWLLRTPRRFWKPILDFVVQLEHGLPEVSEILASESMLERFRVSDKLRLELCEILNNGSSNRIDRLKSQVLALSSKMNAHS